MIQTTEGAGVGSVDNVYRKPFNGSIMSFNIQDNAIITEKIEDEAITTEKLADESVTLVKTSYIQGGLRSSNVVMNANRIKVKAEYSGSPDKTTLKISGHGDSTPVDLMISWKKTTLSSFDSGIIIQTAETNTWYTIGTVNSDGETIEAFVSDRSFHTSYRITMQVRQSNVGSVHLIVETLAVDEI